MGRIGLWAWRGTHTEASILHTYTAPLATAPKFLHSLHQAEGTWRIEVIKRLDKLKLLDGSLIEDEEREAARAEG